MRQQVLDRTASGQDAKRRDMGQLLWTLLVILIPNGDCDDTCEARIAESQNKPGPAQVNPATKIGTPAIHGRFARRFPPPKTGPNN